MTPEITAYFEYLNNAKRRLEVLRPSRGRGIRFTSTIKGIILDATLRGRDLNLSDTEIADRIGISKTVVNRLAGKRETYATPRVNDEPTPDLTPKAELAVRVARAMLPFVASQDSIEKRSVELMQFSERRLQQMLSMPQQPAPKPSTSVIKLTTREGCVIEGLTVEQVVELIKAQ
jgi:hypothetical protein